MAMGLKFVIAVGVALVAVIIVLVAVAQMARKRRQHEPLRQACRLESERVRAESYNQGRAEDRAQAHQAHLTSLAMRPLTADERARFVHRGRAIQARFVDDPTQAVAQADHLIADLLYVRGYPIHDGDQCVADLLLHHPAVAQTYRAAHAIAQASARGEASIADMRTAILLYRAVCAELLERTPTARRPSPPKEQRMAVSTGARERTRTVPLLP